MKKPLIAVPIGDPAGVGPAIVAKSVASGDVFEAADCVIVGDKTIIENAIKIVGEDLKMCIRDRCKSKYNGTDGRVVVIPENT